MKLSDFKGDKGIEVAGKLMIPMMEMLANPIVNKEMQKNVMHGLGAGMVHTPKAIKEMLAVLNDKPVDQIEMDGGVALVGVFEMLDDPALQRLFGLQS